MEKMQDRNGYKVLDHGHVALVDSMGSDLSIVRNARVSYNADWRSGADSGKDAKLINYLVKHHHNTPLESVQLTFDVKAPIFVLRQLMRHRTFSFNEISARYAELPEEFYIPELDQITHQHTSNKQMRTDEQHKHAEIWQKVMRDSNTVSFAHYKGMIADGVPRELARTVLPLATYSHLFATVNLHNLLRFISLRSHIHSQYEIRVFSDAMLEIIKEVCPITVDAFIKHSLNNEP